MAAQTIAQNSRERALLWNWQRATGAIHRTFSLDYQGCECYRVESDRGIWHLQRHPNGTTEDELQSLNALFLLLEEGEYHVSSRYARNDRGDLGSGMLDECWTLSSIASQAQFNTPWVGSSLTSNMLDSAAEVLANIHAYGLVYLHRTNRAISVSPTTPALLTRFSRMFPKIYGSEGQPTGLESCRVHPLMLFRSLVPTDRTQTAGADVIDNTDRSASDPDYVMAKLMDADLSWQPGPSQTSLRYAVLTGRVRHVLEELRREELALGSPETIVHGKFGCESLLFDHSRITKIIGWQGLRLGSPMADLAYAAVMLMTDWTKKCRPHDCMSTADFNRTAFERFYQHYQSTIERLCGEVGMSSSFGRAIQSVTLLTNYMRLACYRILLDQLENDAIENHVTDLRCRMISQVLHIERLLWQ